MFFIIHAQPLLGVGFSGALLLGGTNIVPACEAPKMSREATPAEIRAYFKDQHKTVLTLLGYSAADYEDKAALIAHATEILDHAHSKTTIVNIGATPDGIGAVYELAKKKGFTTSGIVSTQARESKASISPCRCRVLRQGRDVGWVPRRDGASLAHILGHGRGERSPRSHRWRRCGQG